MEIDDNDLGHLSYGLELDDIDDDLHHSTIVRDVAGDKGKEAMGTHETYMVVNRGEKSMEIDEACLNHLADSDIEHLDDCNDAAPVQIASAVSHDSESITPSVPHSVSTLTHVHSTQLSLPLDQQSQSLQTRVTEHSPAIVSVLSQSPCSPLSSQWTPCGQDSPQTLARPVVAPSELI